jgi:hypothetical protein
MSFRRYTVPVLIALVAACGDSTGPEDFSPTDANTQAEAVLSAVTDNPALASLSALAPYMQFGAAQMALSVAPFDPTEPQARTAAERLRAIGVAGPSFGSSASLALFPADLLGQTLVFNPELERYEIDDTATGAPADGVRLILYAVDPILHQILEPLDPVGYLDLIDVSTASSDALQLVAVIEGETFLDYIASATQTTSSVTLAAEGFLSDGTDQVDFDLSLTGTANSVSLNYLLSADGNSVRLEASVNGEGDDAFEATLTIDGDDTVVLDITVTPSTVSGEITYNGDVAVTISGTPEEVTFERPDGTALTAQEINALEALGAIIEELFDAFDNLLAPALVVFALD